MKRISEEKLEKLARISQAKKKCVEAHKNKILVKYKHPEVANTQIEKYIEKSELRSYKKRFKAVKVENKNNDHF